MHELKTHLKTKNYSRVYLFHGEAYLKQQYLQAFEKAVLGGDTMGDMNHSVFDNKTPLKEILTNAMTVPFFADKRLVVAKDTDIFHKKQDDAIDLTTVPESTVLIFVESNIDKRTKLYKQLLKIGTVADLSLPKEDDLIKWVQGRVKKHKKIMDRSTAVYLLRYLSPDMWVIHNEIEKLAFYVSGDTIRPADIDQVCFKSAEVRIFDMLDSIGKKKTSEALRGYHGLIESRNEPLMILAMIARQIRLILRCKVLDSEGYGTKDIASETGVRDFTVKNYLAQGKNFKYKALIAGLEACLHTDLAIKTGKTTQIAGVEQLIIQLCQGNADLIL